MREYCINNDILFEEIDGRKYTGNKLIDYLYGYFKIEK